MTFSRTLTRPGPLARRICLTVTPAAQRVHAQQCSFLFCKIGTCGTRRSHAAMFIFFLHRRPRHEEFTHYASIYIISSTLTLAARRVYAQQCSYFFSNTDTCGTRMSHTSIFNICLTLRHYAAGGGRFWKGQHLLLHCFARKICFPWSMGIKIHIKIALLLERCQKHICIYNTSRVIMQILCEFLFPCSIRSIFWSVVPWVPARRNARSYWINQQSKVE